MGNEEHDIVLDEEAEVNPTAAYSRSKYDAECALLEMVDDNFCPVILRKGTIYGFSPRMRYDLVVNSFVKDGMSKGILTLHNGGEMWRPLIDVRDVANTYIAALQASENEVKGKIFNISHKNFRISEVALRVKEALHECGIKVEIRPEYSYTGVRSYRVLAEKSKSVLHAAAKVSIEESVVSMVEKIREYGYTNFDNPRYYNIRWMQLLENAQRVIAVTGSVFGLQNTDNAEES